MQEILRRHSFSIAFGLIVFGYIFIFVGRGDIQQINGFTMGTTYHLQIADMPEMVEREQLVTNINELLGRLDREIFSTYAPQSELSRLNRQPVNVAFAVSTELLEVLQLSQDVAELSDGAFDITVGPLVNLWGFGAASPAGILNSIPSDEEIAATLARVGYELILIDSNRREVTRLADVEIDLSAIAKGYAVDELAAYLDELGIENYFLEIGGEIKIRGWKPQQESWVAAIEAPVEGAPVIYGTIANNGEAIALAGSGDYRNYFDLAGQRYSHEIDPASGRPVSHNMAAAYVIADSVATADAMATAYMILGPERGAALARRLDQAVYFISRSEGDSFSDYISPQFTDYLQ